MGTVFDVSGNTAYSPKNPYNGIDMQIHFEPRKDLRKSKSHQLTQDFSVRRERRLASPRSIFPQARGLYTRVGGFTGEGERCAQGLVHFFQQAIQHSGQGAALNGLEARNKTPCCAARLRFDVYASSVDVIVKNAWRIISLGSYQPLVICGRPARLYGVKS